MKRLIVRTSQGSYPIWIGRGLFPSAGDIFKRLRLGPKVMIVSNRAVARHYLRPVYESIRKRGFSVSHYLLPFGDERDKSLPVLERLWKQMARIPLERSSTIAALGGGVVGDLCGFAASTYMRGINVVQIPTTLLAQTDASIGGKTAIDLPQAKNIVGTFHQPKAVLSDIGTLQTMSERQWRNSFAEVIKYGMIGDPVLFRLLETKTAALLRSVSQKKFGREEWLQLETIVTHCAQVKADIVSRDERETKGLRMILNYGHTFAHAFEAASGYHLPHGEAVVVGMVLAARLARKEGMCSEETARRQANLIREVGLPLRFSEKDYSVKRLLNFMKRDKKIRNGKLRLVLPREIGRVEVCGEISKHKVIRLLKEFLTNDGA